MLWCPHKIYRHNIKNEYKYYFRAFSEIANTDMPQIVSLFLCGEVKEFVLGLDDIGGIGRQLVFYKSNEPTLVVDNWLFEKESQLDQIVIRLIEFYLTHIQKKGILKK